MFFTFVITTHATEPTASIAELGATLRSAIGLGQEGCALLDMTATEYTQLVTAVEAYCSTNRSTVEPLLEAVTIAKKELHRAYEINAEDIEAKIQAAITAINVLATGCSSLITSIHGGMATERATLFARAAQNRLLDSRVAFLDLTSGQRTALRAAQRARDEVAVHHLKRKNPKLVQEATDTYEAAVNSILTEGQRTARVAMLTDSTERLPAIMIAEAAAQSE